MKEVALAGSVRPGVGKGFARRARMAGDIPAVVYGPEIEPMSISVGERAFQAAMKASTGTTVFDLEVDGKKNKVVLRDIQRDPVTSRVIHLDFHAISMTKPINISVPIKLVGVPEGVKTDGGIMQTTMRDLDISCLPTDIPEQVEIDVTALNIGESIHVSDLDVPHIKILSESQRTIVVISAPTVIKSATTEEEEGEEVEGEAAEGEAAEGEAASAEGDEGAKTEEKKSE